MIHVVQAHEGDWPRYRTIRLSSLRDTPDAFWSTAAEEEVQPEGFWRSRLRAPNHATFLAVHDGVDVGTLVVGPGHDDPTDAGMYAVWVAPSTRGSGAADALVQTAAGWARQRGFRRLRLEVGDHNARAIAFYTKAGFTPTGVSSRFPAPRDHITEHELALML